MTRRCDCGLAFGLETDLAGHAFRCLPFFRAEVGRMKTRQDELQAIADVRLSTIEGWQKKSKEQELQIDAKEKMRKETADALDVVRKALTDKESMRKAIADAYDKLLGELEDTKGQRDHNFDLLNLARKGRGDALYELEEKNRLNGELQKEVERLKAKFPHKGENHCYGPECHHCDAEENEDNESAGETRRQEKRNDEMAEAIKAEVCCPKCKTSCCVEKRADGARFCGYCSLNFTQ